MRAWHLGKLHWVRIIPALMAVVTVVTIPGDGWKSGAIRHGHTSSVVPFWYHHVYRFVADLAWFASRLHLLKELRGVSGESSATFLTNTLSGADKKTTGQY